MEMQNVLICILKEGITETKHIYDDDPVLYTKIEFEPHTCYQGYYTGIMFYPNRKYQGLMDFDVDSFESVVYMEEA